MTDLVPVRVPCPDGQHPDGDSVSLTPKLSFPGGVEARRKINELTDGATQDEVIGLLLDVYIRHGIAEWTLHDDKGELIPVNRQSGSNVGVIGQLHFYLDDLDPRGIGRPIFSGDVQPAMMRRN